MVLNKPIRLQVTRLDEERSRVMARASQFQSNCMQLAAQLKETRDRWQSTCATNVNLQRELMSLRAQVSDWQVTPTLQVIFILAQQGITEVDLQGGPHETRFTIGDQARAADCMPARRHPFTVAGLEAKMSSTSRSHVIPCWRGLSEPGQIHTQAFKCT